MKVQAQKTLLLVEDQAIIAHAEAAKIRLFGYRVITASSGERAIDIALGEEPIDLILMDIDLGRGSDGTEVARRILERRHIPIVFLTSHSEREMVEKVRGITRYGYIIKDSGDFVLQSSIEMALELSMALVTAEENHREYYRLFETMQSGFALHEVVLDEAGKPVDYLFLVVNRAYEEMTGLRRERILGKRATDVLPEIHRDSGNWIARYGGIALGEQSETFEVRSQPFGRSYAITVYSPQHGKFATITEDISDRKWAEEILQKSRMEFKELFDDAPIGYHELDREGNIVRVNKAELQMLGYTAEELVGRPAWMIMKDQAFSQQTLRKKLAGDPGFGGPYERLVCRKDGALLNVLLEDRILRAQDGTIAGIRSVLQDISARKRAEILLLKLSRAVEQSPVTVVITDKDGNIEYANPKFEELTGYSLVEVSGQNPRLLQSGLTPASTYEKMWSSLLSGRAWQGEFANRKKDGSLIWAKAWISPIVGDDGSITHFVGVNEDVTARKASDLMLLEYQDALRQFVGHLEATIEHERTQIAREVRDALGQILSALKVEAVAILDAGADNGDHCSNRVSSMCELIDSGLQTVREISGRLRPGVLDNLGLVSAIRWHAQDMQKRAGVRCHLSLPEEDVPLDPPVVLAVFRVFQELMTNIGRHASARSVFIALSLNDKGVTLTVKDDGVGITDAATRSPRSFGLMGIRERLQPLDGVLTIVGNPGRGTRASVFVPVLHPAGNNPPRRSEVPSFVDESSAVSS